MPGAEPQGMKSNFHDLRTKAQHHRAKHVETQMPSKLNPGIRAKAQGPSGLKLESSVLKPRDLLGDVGSSWGPDRVHWGLLRTFWKPFWKPLGPFGSFLKPLGSPLRASLGPLEGFVGGLLGASWGAPGTLWGSWGLEAAHGAAWGRLAVIYGTSMGPSWAPLGPQTRPLGPFLAPS